MFNLTGNPMLGQGMGSGLAATPSFSAGGMDGFMQSLFPRTQGTNMSQIMNPGAQQPGGLPTDFLAVMNSFKQSSAANQNQGPPRAPTAGMAGFVQPGKAQMADPYLVDPRLTPNLAQALGWSR